MNKSFLKYFLSIIISFYSGILNASSVDSLKYLISITEIDSVKADLYFSLANEYYLGNQEAYLSNIDKAVEFAGKSHDYARQRYFVYSKGFYYFNLSQYAKASIVFKEFLELAEDRNELSSIAKACQLLGMTYKYWGKYDKAVDYCQRSIDLYAKISDKKGLGQSNNILCWIYEAWGDNATAEKFGYKAFNYLQPYGISSPLAYTTLALANCKVSKDSLVEALRWYNKAWCLFKEIKDEIGLSYVYRDKGRFYLKQLNYVKAQCFLDSAQIILERVNNSRGMSEIYVLQGILCSYTNDYRNAIRLVNKGLDIARKIDLQEDIVKDIRALSQIYLQSGDLKNALNYERLYSDTKDSVFSRMKFEQMSELRERYETDKKENELKVQKSLINRQRFLLFFLCLLIILAIAFVILLLKLYKSKKKSNQQLARQKAEIDFKNERLKELDEVKSRFFSNISHEFRTPLTLIKGPAEQLSQELTDNKQKAASQLIVKSANRLQNLINQLLDLSRLERGRMKLQITLSDLSAFIRTRVSLFSSFAEERNIRLIFEMPTEETNLYFDADKLEKIIYNLLSNAFKFTDERGSIHISLQIDSESKYFNFMVSDTGKGIPENQLPYIFDRFYQVTSSGSYQNEGSGIGLALVKEIVELYRGTISVTSEPGKGSAFMVKLPCSAEAFSDNEITKDTIVENELPSDLFIPSKPVVEFKMSSSGPLILVVEDNQDMRRYIISNMYDNYRTIEACNGVEGLKIALKENPDMIISDVMMPEMDGYQFTSAIKNNAQTSHVPVILLTAKAAEESLLKGFENEADDYLVKPFSVKELKARVRNLIRVREKLKEKFSKCIVVNPSEIATTSLDEQFLQTALHVVEKHMDNPEFTAEILCNETGVSRANMHRKLKALINQSATEFIRSIRLKRAAQLLQQNSGNISEVATMVGFNTLSYFTSCFKEAFNCLPSEYGKNGLTT